MFIDSHCHLDAPEFEADRAAAAQALVAATTKRERWAPLWKWAKTSAVATAIAIGAYAVKALDERGDARRVAQQQAAMVDDHAATLRRLTPVVLTDHATLSFVAAQLGIPMAPAPVINP